ncbi:MAG: hypothetical protein ACE5LB_09075, partial [Acidiferrobacterales bacterium]
ISIKGGPHLAVSVARVRGDFGTLASHDRDPTGPEDASPPPDFSRRSAAPFAVPRQPGATLTPAARSALIMDLRMGAVFTVRTVKYSALSF